MKTLHASLLALVAATLLAPAAHAAAVISFYGFQVNTPEWRSTNFTKTITLAGGGTITDEDNAYGTLGWNLPTVNGAPSFISPAAAGTLTANRGGAGYEPIDDPTEPIGPNVADLPPAFRAIAFQLPAFEGEANLYQLTLQGSIPSSFIIGVGFGNLLNPGENAFGAASYRASVGASTTAQIPAISNDGLTDWIFFRVNEGVAGEVINIFGTSASTNGGFVSLAALSYDVTPIPEPGTVGLLIIGGLGLAVLRRKRTA